MISIPTKKAASGEEAALSMNSKISVRSDGGWSRRDDVYAATFLVEEHPAIDEREKRVVPAATDAQARMDLGAALTDDDVSSDHSLAAEFFHAEALAAGIATVLDGALSFFMGHKSG